jgi:hypothetical protein
VNTDAIGWSNAHAPDRSVLAGVAGIRCFEYVSQDIDDPARERLKLRPIAGLQVRSFRSDEAAVFHPTTGIYGFLHLSPGTHRIHITDPAGRYLPCAAEVEAPDRGKLVAALERGVVPGPGPLGAGYAPPLYRDLALRIAPGFQSPAPLTLVWGQVRAADGTPVALARLQFRTKIRRSDGQRVNGRVITHADERGAYQAWLPDEKAVFELTPAADENDPDIPTLQTRFVRKLERVNALKPEALAALRSDVPMRGVPLARHVIAPASAGTTYEFSANFLLWKDGLPPPGPNPDEIEIEVNARRRWDVVLV